MPSRSNCLLAFIAFSAIVWLGTNITLAQKSVSEFHNILHEKAAFNETDFAALGQGRAVVRLLPVRDREKWQCVDSSGFKWPLMYFSNLFGRA